MMTWVGSLSGQISPILKHRWRSVTASPYDCLGVALTAATLVSLLCASHHRPQFGLPGYQSVEGSKRFVPRKLSRLLPTLTLLSALSVAIVKLTHLIPHSPRSVVPADLVTLGIPAALSTLLTSIMWQGIEHLLHRTRVAPLWIYTPTKNTKTPPLDTLSPYGAGFVTYSEDAVTVVHDLHQTPSLIQIESAEIKSVEPLPGNALMIETNQDTYVWSPSAAPNPRLQSLDEQFQQPHVIRSIHQGFSAEYLSGQPDRMIHLASPKTVHTLPQKYDMAVALEGGRCAWHVLNQKWTLMRNNKRTTLTDPDNFPHNVLECEGTDNQGFIAEYNDHKWAIWDPDYQSHQLIPIPPVRDQSITDVDYLSQTQFLLQTSTGALYLWDARSTTHTSIQQTKIDLDNMLETIDPLANGGFIAEYNDHKWAIWDPDYQSHQLIPIPIPVDQTQSIKDVASLSATTFLVQMEDQTLYIWNSRSNENQSIHLDDTGLILKTLHLLNDGLIVGSCATPGDDKKQTLMAWQLE